jgi:hypothetical protein
MPAAGLQRGQREGVPSLLPGGSPAASQLRPSTAHWAVDPLWNPLLPLSPLGASRAPRSAPEWQLSFLRAARESSESRVSATSQPCRERAARRFTPPRLGCDIHCHSWPSAAKPRIQRIARKRDFATAKQVGGIAARNHVPLCSALRASVATFTVIPSGAQRSRGIFARGSGQPYRERAARHTTRWARYACAPRLS